MALSCHPERVEGGQVVINRFMLRQAQHDVKQIKSFGGETWNIENWAIATWKFR